MNARGYRKWSGRKILHTSVAEIPVIRPAFNENRIRYHPWEREGSPNNHRRVTTAKFNQGGFYLYLLQRLIGSASLLP